MRRKDLFFGLLFILAAALIIINQFGFFTGVSMFDIVATVILSGIFIKSVYHMNFWGIFFPLALICIIFDDQLNITGFTPWPVLLTALLFSIGFSLIFKRSGVWFHHQWDATYFGSKVQNEQDGSIIRCSATFGECMKYVNSENFEKAEISSSFGEVKVYFDKAQIPSGKADIYLNVSFGEAVLYIPSSWKIINKTGVFLGEFSEKNNNSGAVSPIVTIHGNISFGEAEIIYI